MTTTAFLMALPAFGGQRDGASPPTAEIIAPESIRAHMAVLADDDMEGRETGTPGFDRAARYVASQFDRLGLRPLSGGYLQEFSLRRARVDETRSSLSITLGGHSTSLAYGDDFVTYGSTSEADLFVSGDLVFVGDGVTVSERHVDAYRGLDVRGKVVIAVPGAPAILTSTERRRFDNVETKAENAGQHGAAALIVVDDVPWELRKRPRISSERRLGCRSPSLRVSELSCTSTRLCLLGSSEFDLMRILAELGRCLGLRMYECGASGETCGARTWWRYCEDLIRGCGESML